MACGGGNTLLGSALGDKRFDDPFLLPSSDVIPTSFSDTLDFCKFIYYLNPAYAKASQRVVRHFITNFSFPGKGSSDEKSEFEDYLTYELKLQHYLAEMGDEERVYGNAFYRMYYPFRRFLIDEKNGKKYSLNVFPEEDIKFDLKTLTYEVTDPSTLTHKKRKRIRLPFKDFKNTDSSEIRPVKIDPREMVIIRNFYSDEKRYVWLFSEIFKKEIRDGVIYQVNQTPVNILKAIRDEKAFIFNSNAIFHFHNTHISGVTDGGWAFPETMANFRDIYQTQIYRKIDEVVGKDYMLPFRIFSPPNSNDPSSPVANVINKAWNAHVRKAIEVRRKDKLAMFAFPFPVNYQEFGGQGKSLTPKDLISYQQDSLLNSMGYPAELFRASLQIQQVPTAIRLFENSFWFIHLGFNSFVNWVCMNIQTYQDKEVITVRMERPSIADDIDRQNIKVQLGMQGEIPRSYFMGNLGINNPVEAKRERLEEDMKIAEIEQKAQMDFEKSMTAVQAQGVLPNSPQGQGGGEQAMSPLDVEDRAAQKAQEWLSMDEGMRRKDMEATKGQSFNLYSMAKEIMEQQRRQGASEGRQGVYQQAQQ